MNLAYRDVAHNLFRFVLTCVGLGLLLGVVLAMIGIYRGIVVDALAVVRSHGADIWVVEADTLGPFAESSRIPGDTRESVARIAGVAAAGAVTYQTIETTRGDGKLRVFVVGYQPGRLGGPAQIKEGRGIARSHYELLADVRTGLRVDDRLKLGRENFHVVGLIADQVASSGDPVVYMTLADSQKLQFDLAPPAARIERARGGGNTGTDTVNAVIARVQPGVSPEQVVDSVRRWKHLGAMTQAEQESILTQSVVDRARRQIGLFMTILLLVSAVIIALIIYTMTMEKIRQIATLKLIGAPDRTIVGMIVQQALALGMGGFLIGAVLILTVKDYFPRRVVMEPETTLFLAGIVFVVCLLASGLGVRVAMRVDPATALGG